MPCRLVAVPRKIAGPRLRLRSHSCDSNLKIDFFRPCRTVEVALERSRSSPRPPANESCPRSSPVALEVPGKLLGRRPPIRLSLRGAARGKRRERVFVGGNRLLRGAAQVKKDQGLEVLLVPLFLIVPAGGLS